MTIHRVLTTGFGTIAVACCIIWIDLVPRLEIGDVASDLPRAVGWPLVYHHLNPDEFSWWYFVMDIFAAVLLVVCTGRVLHRTRSRFSLRTIAAFMIAIGFVCLILVWENEKWLALKALIQCPLGSYVPISSFPWIVEVGLVFGLTCFVFSIASVILRV